MLLLIDIGVTKLWLDGLLTDDFYANVLLSRNSQETGKNRQANRQVYSLFKVEKPSWPEISRQNANLS